jgi:hypothetical protein
MVSFCSFASGLLGGEGKREWVGLRASSPLFFVKRNLRCFVFSRISLLHLASHGGDEVGKSDLKLIHHRGGSRLEHLEIRLFTAFQP